MEKIKELQKNKKQLLNINTVIRLQNVNGLELSLFDSAYFFR